MRGDDLSRRLMEFAVRCIKVAEALPRTAVGVHVSRQLLRAGTSAGANYEEARGAESRADFAHKLGVVLKELKESRYWVHVAQGAGLVKGERVGALLEECEALCGITAKSIMTTRGQKKKEA